jgi:hypothetical protein
MQSVGSVEAEPEGGARERTLVPLRRGSGGPAVVLAGCWVAEVDERRLVQTERSRV